MVVFFFTAFVKPKFHRSVQGLILITFVMGTSWVQPSPDSREFTQEHIHRHKSSQFRFWWQISQLCLLPPFRYKQINQEVTSETGFALNFEPKRLLSEGRSTLTQQSFPCQKQDGFLSLVATLAPVQLQPQQSLHPFHACRRAWPFVPALTTSLSHSSYK